MTSHPGARWTITSLVCLCVSLQGCTTPFAGGRFQRSHRETVADTPKKAATKSKLKDPGGLYLAYGRWQEQLGNLNEARSSYEQALSEQPKSIDAILGLARLDQLGGRITQAETGFQRALAMQPKSPKVLDAVGQFYLSQEKWDKSIQMLKSAAESEPGNPSYAFHLAVALAESGKPDEALPLFAKSVGDAEAHYNIGLILHKQGKLQASAEQFEQALQIQPTLREAEFWLADINGHSDTGVQLANGSNSVPPTDPAGRPSEVSNAGHTSPSQRSTSSFGSRTTPPPTPASAAAPNRPGMSPSQWEQWRNQSAARPDTKL